MRRRSAWCLLLSTGALLGCSPTSHLDVPPKAVSPPVTTPAPRPPSHAPRSLADRTWAFGLSRNGVPLIAVRRRTPGATATVLVVGCIHGDECAGTAIVDQLMTAALPPRADLVLVRTVNPDGGRLHRRQNAAGVDLNRNFPQGWTLSGRPGDQQYPGPRALSEPESRAVAALVRDLRPAVTVWFHQAVDVVDESGGSVTIEAEFARRTGQRLVRLQRYPGSVCSWQNTLFPRSTAFVDELPRPMPRSLRPWTAGVAWLLAQRYSAP